MLRILGQIEECGREIPARNMVRAMREVFSADLTSDAACRPSVREVRRPDDGPIETAGGDQPFHPGEVGIWFPKEQPDKLIKVQGRGPSVAGKTTGTEPGKACFPHGGGSG